MKSTICVVEDRKICEPSLKLLLLSLNLHCPEAVVNLFYPPATGSFLIWLRKCPQVSLRTEQLMTGYGWNVKPQAIIRLFEAGYDEVIWIDSDVIVNQDPLRLFARLSRDTVAATEDALGDDHDDGEALRAHLWGFSVGRILPFGLNTGVLRVTKDHYDLIQKWWELLQGDEYQHVQNQEWTHRPVHMLGDQDVLTALLTSKAFSHIPLYLLVRGRNILQFDGVWGYTVAERTMNALGNVPTFIHQFGHKPWHEEWRCRGVKEYIKKIYLDLSPYTVTAMHFKRELECDTRWMEPHYAPSRILRTLGMGRSSLVGLPLAIVLDLARIAKWALRAFRMVHSKNHLDRQPPAPVPPV
jgi:hypothetical protein